MKVTNTKLQEIAKALREDPMKKAWLGPNHPLFIHSEKHSDMFLTTYRLKNAYENLLEKLETGEEVKEEKDLVLVERIFRMDFYAPRKLSLSSWKEGVDPTVRIEKAVKEERWKKHGKRPFEITLHLSDGNTYQINLADTLNRFAHIRNTIQSLIESED